MSGRKTPKRQLKRLLVGIEGEVATLNRKGQVVNKADAILKHLDKHKQGHSVKKECAEHMIEIVSSPHQHIRDTLGNFFGQLEHVLLAAEKHDSIVFPLGMYPGKFNPTMRKGQNYRIKESILGKQRFRIAGRCFGFHCHFTLPKGTFDSHERFIRVLTRSSKKDAMMYNYNMLIAMDPALTTLTQCSPFYEGKYLGKDARMIVYRGGDYLKNKNALYAKFPEFGELPPYKATTLDLLSIIGKRWDDWGMQMKNLGVNIKTLSQYGSTLDTTWNPVKVNPNGTLEQRGMDMCHPASLLGASILIKRILRSIHDEDITVVPSDIALKEPFRLEGKTLYITPHSHVRQNLQYAAAYEGLENDELLNYCKRLLALGKKLMPKDRLPLIEPFEKMVRERKTVSDEILASAKKHGWSKKKDLDNKQAASIALDHSKRLYKEIVEARRKLQRLD